MRNALIGATLLIAGCAGGMTHQAEEIARTGQPVAYVQGYDDGCRTGKLLAGSSLTGEFRKNTSRYGVERLYTVGWDDGKERCKADVESFNPRKR